MVADPQLDGFDPVVAIDQQLVTKQGGKFNFLIKGTANS